MARTPKPWFRRDRGAWFVTIDGARHNLGPERKSAFQRFHQLMARPKMRPVSSHSPSVVEIIDSFLDWTKRHRAVRTYEWYKQRCQWFIDHVADITTEELRPFHVQAWLDNHPNWSDGHRRGCIIAVQRPFRWATRMGYIDESPILHIEKPAAGRREQIISEAEFESILETVGDDAFRDLLNAAWQTGARPQELMRVEARHVDFGNSRWVFPQAEAKGKRRVRIVYLSDEALGITKRMMLKHPEGPLFRNTRDRPWKAYAINCRFQRIKEKLSVKYCLYAFRHSFATRMLEKGLDALTVSILMGHSDTTMLGRVYQHLSHNPQHLLKQLREAAN